MRKDVKVGLVLSLVVVVVAGLYYVGRDKKADPVKLDDTPTLADKPAGAKGPVADARNNRLKPGANKPNTGGRPVVPPSNPRISPKPPPAGSLTPPPEGGTVKADPVRPQVKPDTSAAVGTKSESVGQDLATAKDPARDPLASPSASPPPFDNLFQFGKGPTEPGSTEADEPSSVRPADPSASPSQDSRSEATKPRTGMDPKTGAPLPPAPGSDADSGEPVRTHKVERGDTYALLAEHYYGSQRYAQFLMDANPEHADPMKLREGMVLKVPPRPGELPSAAVKKTTAPPSGANPNAATADSGGERRYTVKEDDTLYGIASRELGRGGRWPELLELNKDALKGSPERLRVGQTLKLPPGEKLDAKKP